MLIFLPILGYFVGFRFRGLTHSILPFMEPLTYILIALTLLPIFIYGFWEDWSVSVGFNPFDLDFVALYLGFWLGYLIGYMQNETDVIYVGVHQIVDRTQDIEPIVRYYNSNGQMCWQPQGFLNICRTLFFGIHHPLQLSGSINRTRRVSMRNQFFKITADTIDLAGMEEHETEVVKCHIHFTVRARKYIPSPNCTDSPYDWIVRAQEYEDVFVEFQEMQVAAAESKAAMQSAMIKGGALIYNALATKTPSNMVMEDLGREFEEDVKAKAKSRSMKRASEEAAAEAGQPQGAADR
ncbi:MAG: hypothetical protein Q4Q58_07085 [Thermoplasmata archaeon]|nr:hypothetical protein [Thermoplasmata archaeon]